MIRHSPPVVDDEVPVWVVCVGVIAVAVVIALPKDAIKTVISTGLTVSTEYSINDYKSKDHIIMFVDVSSVIHAVELKLIILVFPATFPTCFRAFNHY